MSDLPQSDPPSQSSPKEEPPTQPVQESSSVNPSLSSIAFTPQALPPQKHGPEAEPPPASPANETPIIKQDSDAMPPLSESFKPLPKPEVAPSPSISPVTPLPTVDTGFMISTTDLKKSNPKPTPPSSSVPPSASPPSPAAKRKKSSGKLLLLVTVLLLLFTMPIAVYYISQQQHQIAELRKKAANEIKGCPDACTAQQTLLQSFWIDNNGYWRTVQFKADGTPDWNNAGKWSAPISATASAMPLPGSGNMQSQAGLFFKDNSVYQQGIWRGNQGFYRTVPVKSDGSLDWNNASKWNDKPIDTTGLPGSGDMQDQAFIVYPNGTIMQGIWRNNTGYYRTLGYKSDGTPDWDHASNWSAPLESTSSAVPGSGNVQSLGGLFFNQVYQQGMWRGGKGYYRTIPVLSDGSLDWKNPGSWSEVADTSVLPAKGTIQAQDEIVFSPKTGCEAGLVCDTGVCKIPECVGASCTCSATSLSSTSLPTNTPTPTVQSEPNPTPTSTVELTPTTTNEPTATPTPKNESVQPPADTPTPKPDNYQSQDYQSYQPPAPPSSGGSSQQSLTGHGGGGAPVTTAAPIPVTGSGPGVVGASLVGGGLLLLLMGLAL